MEVWVIRSVHPGRWLDPPPLGFLHPQALLGQTKGSKICGNIQNDDKIKPFEVLVAFFELWKTVEPTLSQLGKGKENLKKGARRLSGCFALQLQGCLHDVSFPPLEPLFLFVLPIVPTKDSCGRRSPCVTGVCRGVTGGGRAQGVPVSLTPAQTSSRVAGAIRLPHRLSIPHCNWSACPYPPQAGTACAGVGHLF